MSESEEETSSGADCPVTVEWIMAVLAEHHKDLKEHSTITVMDFTVKPGCDAGESVLSDILAVSVKYDLSPVQETHNLCFVVKLLPQDPFSRFFVTEAQFDLREIKFYTQIVPDLESFKSKQLGEQQKDEMRLPIPRCYYANYSTGTTEPEPSPPESVLVLENIKPKGYSGADFSRGLTLRQASAAIDAVARVHGLSLAFKMKECGGNPLAEHYPFLFQTSRASDSYQQLVERGLPQLSQFLERRSGLEDVLAALTDLRPRTKEAIERLLSPKEPTALITHTDFWCNNLMFKEERTDSTSNGSEDNAPGCSCVILDWQMVTYSNPTNDVALLLVSSVPAELRRLHTDRLLDRYWEGLITTCSRLGVDVEGDLGYDRRQLEKDYRRSQLLALLLCIGSVDLALGNAQMEERLLELLKDLHADGLLNADVIDKPET